MPATLVRAILAVRPGLPPESTLPIWGSSRVDLTLRTAGKMPFAAAVPAKRASLSGEMLAHAELMRVLANGAVTRFLRITPTQSQQPAQPPETTHPQRSHRRNASPPETHRLQKHRLRQDSTLPATRLPLSRPEKLSLRPDHSPDPNADQPISRCPCQTSLSSQRQPPHDHRVAKQVTDLHFKTRVGWLGPKILTWVLRLQS